VDERDIQRTKAANLWETYTRKAAPLAKSTRIDPRPGTDFADIGGLEAPKEEISTYACAATDPEVYQRWGTQSPTGMLLMGPAGSGKTLLAQALATRTETPFLRIDVPRFVLQVVHSGGKAGEILAGVAATLAEMPRTTIFYDELDFAHDLTIGAPRPDLPTSQITDFLIELIDASIGTAQMLIVGSTSRPDTLSPIYFEPGRFERIVSVQPQVPEDVIEALRIHISSAEKRAERKLFEGIDWNRVIEQNRNASIGNWVRMIHAVLRFKARCDTADERPGLVTTVDVLDEVERFKRTATRLPPISGRYL
jgi:ATP-dependent 26S proteasome regulatory subunit